METGIVTCHTKQRLSLPWKPEGNGEYILNKSETKKSQYEYMYLNIV
jgi:hypothetical protein